MSHALRLLLLCLLFFCTSAPALGQGPPPANVVIAPSSEGKVRPTSTFVGTVTYPEVSNVASEVEGRVLSVDFEEGRRVEKGQTLVVCDTSVRRRDLSSARAQLEEARASLSLAEIELNRAEKLVGGGTISEQEYDQRRFRVLELKRRVGSLKALVDRLNVLLDKAVIKAPFSGIVLDKGVERGEWVAGGTAVAVIARDDEVDVIVTVPDRILPYLRQGDPAEVTIFGIRTQGEIFAVIPQGDVGTRTFPVKVRMKNENNFAQGMEASVALPVSEAVSAVIVPRDAVIPVMGRTSLYYVSDGTAVQVPVRVLAYQGTTAAVEPEGGGNNPLKPGMDIIIKGHERLFMRGPDPKVNVIPDTPGESQAPEGKPQG